MGYILHILLALATLAAADLGPASDASVALLVPLLALPLILGGHLVRGLILRGRFRAAGAVERLLTLAPAPLQAVAVILLGWCRALEPWLGLDITLEGWPGPEVFVGIAPYALFQLAVIDARARLGASRETEVWKLRAFQVRLFLSALVPVTLFIAVSTLIRWDEVLRVHVEEVALLNAAASAVMLGSMVLILPTILRRTWETVPIERGWQRTLLEDVARAASFRCRELLLWRTALQMTNAAIVGFTKRSRLVLFSDALLAQLPPRQLAAVFAHEIGHAKRRHAEIFALYAVFLFLCLDLGTNWLVDLDEVWLLAASAAAILLWCWSFGFLSRRFELEADLASADLLGDPGPLVAALETVVGAHARTRSSWRHFSTSVRTEFLERVRHDPADRRRLERVLRTCKRLILIGVALAGVVETIVLTRSWDEDHIVVGLRLGDYEEASRGLAAAPDVDEELARLVGRAASQPFSERSPEALEARAQSSLAAGDVTGAVEYLQLALLREVDERREALLAALRGGDEEALRALLKGPGEEAWREALGG